MTNSEHILFLEDQIGLLTTALESAKQALASLQEETSQAVPQLSDSDKSVSDRVKDGIAIILGIGHSELSTDTLLVSLGADSLEVVEITMFLEEEFEIEIDDEEVVKCTTVQDLIVLVERMLK